MQIEYSLISLQDGSAKLALVGADVLELMTTTRDAIDRSPIASAGLAGHLGPTAAADAAPDLEDAAQFSLPPLVGDWKPEYGSFMVESSPERPLGTCIGDLIGIQRSMAERRICVGAYAARFHGAVPFTVVQPPMLGADYDHRNDSAVGSECDGGTCHPCSWDSFTTRESDALRDSTTVPPMPPGGPLTRSSTVTDAAIGAHRQVNTVSYRQRTGYGAHAIVRVLSSRSDPAIVGRLDSNAGYCVHRSASSSNPAATSSSLSSLPGSSAVTASSTIATRELAVFALSRARLHYKVSGTVPEWILSHLPEQYRSVEAIAEGVRSGVIDTLVSRSVNPLPPAYCAPTAEQEALDVQMDCASFPTRGAATHPLNDGEYCHAAGSAAPTPKPPTSSAEAAAVRHRNAAHPEGDTRQQYDHIHLDSRVYGFGCSCLQVTVQAADEEESRYIHDMAVVLGPILLALSANTPIWRGRLAASDTRWRVLSHITDDRTPSERGCAGAVGVPTGTNADPGAIRLSDEQTTAASSSSGSPAHASGPTARARSDRDPAWTALPGVDAFAGAGLGALVPSTRYGAADVFIGDAVRTTSLVDANSGNFVDRAGTDKQPSRKCHRESATLDYSTYNDVPFAVEPVVRKIMDDQGFDPCIADYVSTTLGRSIVMGFMVPRATPPSPTSMSMSALAAAHQDNNGAAAASLSVPSSSSTLNASPAIAAVAAAEGLVLDPDPNCTSWDRRASSVWKSARWKVPALKQPPLPQAAFEQLQRQPSHSANSGTIAASLSTGWRVEYRTMEAQLTDFEAAAFIIVTVLLTRAMCDGATRDRGTPSANGPGGAASGGNGRDHHRVSRNPRPDWYVPMSLVHSNFDAADGVGGVVHGRFWWRANHDDSSGATIATRSAAGVTDASHATLRSTAAAGLDFSSSILTDDDVKRCLAPDRNAAAQDISTAASATSDAAYAAIIVTGDDDVAASVATITLSEAAVTMGPGGGPDTCSAVDSVVTWAEAENSPSGTSPHYGVVVVGDTLSDHGADVAETINSSLVADNHAASAPASSPHPPPAAHVSIPPPASPSPGIGRLSLADIFCGTAAAATNDNSNQQENFFASINCVASSATSDLHTSRPYVSAPPGPLRAAGPARHPQFDGLVPIVRRYLKSSFSSTATPAVIAAIEPYLAFLEARARGEVLTGAAWQRDFVRRHPHYRGDGLLSQSITADLMAEIAAISGAVSKLAVGQTLSAEDTDILRSQSATRLLGTYPEAAAAALRGLSAKDFAGIF